MDGFEDERTTIVAGSCHRLGIRHNTCHHVRITVRRLHSAFWCARGAWITGAALGQGVAAVARVRVVVVTWWHASGRLARGYEHGRMDLAV